MTKPISKDRTKRLASRLTRLHDTAVPNGALQRLAIEFNYKTDRELNATKDSPGEDCRKLFNDIEKMVGALPIGFRPPATNIVIARIPRLLFSIRNARSTDHP